MKKQLLALTCALTIGVGWAVTPAGNQSAEPTGQVGYYLASRQTSSEAARTAAASGGSSLGGRTGEAVGRHLVSLRAGARGVGARVMIVRAASVGARVGAIGGFAGLLIGTAVGAA